MSFRSTCPTCSMVSVFPDPHRNTPHTCKRCGEFRFLQDDAALSAMGPAPAPAAPQPILLVQTPQYHQPQQPAVVARPRGFLCPYCGGQSPPIIRQQISTAGWVVFVVLLLVCIPLCFIGIFIKEDYRVCSGCGIKLG